jgi:hypothetical protein
MMPADSLLPRLLRRTERPGCLRRTPAQAILARHLRTAAVPPLADLLLRRARTTDYPAPPITVTATRADPGTGPPRRSPTARTTPSAHNDVAFPLSYQAPPNPQAPSSRSGPGAPQKLLVSAAIATQTTNLLGRKDGDGDRPSAGGTRTRRASNAEGQASTTSGVGAGAAGGARSAGGAGGVRAAGAVSGAAGELSARRATVTVDAIGRADPPGPTWRTRLRSAPLAAHEPPSAPTAHGDAYSTSAPAPDGQTRPVVAPRVTVTQRPIVRETPGNAVGRRPLAVPAGMATRTLPGGTAPPGPREGTPPGDKPAEPARGGRAPQRDRQQRDDPTKRDPTKRDGDKPHPPPAVDINGIVTTVQRRLMHHTAIERERRGIPR